MPSFLHVGCGPARKGATTPGFNTSSWSEVRLDIDSRARPDIVGSMTDMSAVADGAMDGLFSSHNIEHLYPFEVPLALAEFHRVLAADGFAVITCPDLRSVAELVAQDRLTEAAYTSPAGPITPLDIIYGHQADLARGNLYMAHRTGFTSRTLEAALRAAGFARVVMLRRPRALDLWALASKSPRRPEDLQGLVDLHFPLAAPGAA